MAHADLALLRARERSKRFVVGGVVGLLYATGWLFIAWRASRIAETECTVVYVEQAAACTLRHIAGGEQHTLPYEDCGQADADARLVAHYLDSVRQEP